MNDSEITGCVPDNIAEDELEDLAEKARDYLQSQSLKCVPFTLFPYPIPEECFSKACRAQQSYNLLVHKVAHDHEFLELCLSRVIKTDPCTRKLWDIYHAVQKEGVIQKVSLGINRSDYLMDLDSEGGHHIKQVEINTMYSAGATAGCCISACHKCILQTNNMSELADKVADNKAVNGLVKSLEAAWTYYNNPEAVLVFVEEKDEIHMKAYDQIMLGHFKHDITIIRKTFREMHSLSLKGPARKLFIDGHEVAVLYYCFPGGSPDLYKCQKNWTARLDMERSLAIKCPSIGGQLAGTKKVQQVLAEPGMLERFFTDPEEIKRIRDTFTGHYSLDTSSRGDLAIEKARKNPDRYVIKPQREGGGNNAFGDDIPRLLDRIENTEERNGYVMMDVIKTAVSRNVLVKPLSSIERMKVVGELGVYGALLGSAHQVLLNTYCGHFVKCKPEDIDEGGVQSGNGFVSSVLLV